MADAPAGGLLLRREVRFRAFERTAKYSDAIDQEAAVGRIMAPTLTDTAIHAQAVAASQAVFVRQHQHAIIHLVERLGSHKPFQIVLGRMVRHRVIVNPCPALIGLTIPNGFFGLPIGPFLPSAQEDEPIAGFQ